MRQDEKNALIEKASMIFARIKKSYERASEEIKNNAGRAFLAAYNVADHECEEYPELIDRIGQLGGADGDVHGVMCDAHEMLGVLMDAQVDNSSYAPDPKHELKVRHKVWALTDGHCAYCDERLGNDWHVDHVVPVASGGPNSLENYVPACPSCNISKNCGHVIDFIRRRRKKVVELNPKTA